MKQEQLFFSSLLACFLKSVGCFVVRSFESISLAFAGGHSEMVSIPTQGGSTASVQETRKQRIPKKISHCFNDDSARTHCCRVRPRLAEPEIRCYHHHQYGVRGSRILRRCDHRPRPPDPPGSRRCRSSWTWSECARNHEAVRTIAPAGGGGGTSRCPPTQLTVSLGQPLPNVVLA